MTSPKHQGRLITFEGGEGSGKSTQAEALARRLRDAGYPVCLTGEPAGAAFDRTVKAFLGWTGRAAEPLSPLAEMLLFQARRAQHVARVIRPALGRGQIVLCDRFTDSTVAYQGYGRGLSLTAIRTCNRIATGGLLPHLTLLFDVPPEIGLARADRAGKDHDAIGQESADFHTRVREGYLALARAEPERIVVIDATLPPAEVTEHAWSALLAHVLAGWTNRSGGPYHG